MKCIIMVKINYRTRHQQLLSALTYTITVGSLPLPIRVKLYTVLTKWPQFCFHLFLLRVRAPLFIFSPLQFCCLGLNLTQDYITAYTDEAHRSTDTRALPTSYKCSHVLVETLIFTLVSWGRGAREEERHESEGMETTYLLSVTSVENILATSTFV
jgi:hypothetical protein